MMNKVIRGFTRILGKPLDWKAEDHGKCGALAILDLEEDIMGTGVISNSMISAWDPTTDEMRKLKLGASVYLRVAGVGHPPVAIWVGDPPIDGQEPTQDDLEQFREQMERELENRLRGMDVDYPCMIAEQLSRDLILWYRAGRVLNQ